MRLIPYVISETKAFIIVLTNDDARSIDVSDNTVRPILNGTTIFSAYDDADLDEIQFSQSGTLLFIVHQNREPVVMISLQDYRSMQETAYLMQSFKNASRLNEAIEQLETGFGKKRELIEE